VPVGAGLTLVRVLMAGLFKKVRLWVVRSGETRDLRRSVDPNNPACEFMTQYKYGPGARKILVLEAKYVHTCIRMYVLDD
jgi:hypothetical protein